MPRFSTTGQCASQRPPGERQNGEAKAGDHNAPQCCGRRIQVGPFGPSSGCSLGVICRCRSPRGGPRSAVLPPLLPSPGSYPRTTRVRSRHWQLQPLLWSESQVAVYGRELPGCFVFTAIQKIQFKTGHPSAVRPVLAFVRNCDVSHMRCPTKRRSVQKAVQILLPQSSTQLYVPVGQPFDVS